MQSARFGAALASAAILLGAVQGAAFAQTTMAPTPAPVVGPTMAAPKSPMMGSSQALMMAIPTPGGTLALGARGLRARRTATGYTLTGRSQVKDACEGARFDPSRLTIYPPQYDLNQFRRPDMMGKMCVMRLAWVTAQPRVVTSMKPPAYVTVHTQKGVQRVPIR